MRKSTAMRLVALALLIVVIAAPSYHIYHSNGDSFDFSNTETKVVVSGSMDGKVRSEYDIPTIPLGSMVFIQKPVSDTFYESLSVGDILTFHYTDPVSKKDMIVTHRIIGVTYTGYDYKYVLAGDAIVDDPSNASTQTVYSSSGRSIRAARIRSGVRFIGGRQGGPHRIVRRHHCGHMGRPRSHKTAFKDREEV